MRTSRSGWLRRGTRNRTWHWAALALLIATATGAVYLSMGSTQQSPSVASRLVDFQQYRYGVVPDEFAFDATGAHGPVLSAGQPLWRAYVDLFAPSPKMVLVQASQLAADDHYPFAVLEGFTAQDISLSVHLKPVDGRLARSAGLLWRFQDKDNYYATLVDATRREARLIAVVGGKPRLLAATPIEIDVEFELRSPSPDHGWSSLAVEMRGRTIEVWYQGQQAIVVVDETFNAAGGVGLVTHADTVVLFDDLRVETLRANQGR